MKIIYNDITGEILGMARGILDGDSFVEITTANLTWGKDNDFYTVVDGVFTAKTLAEVRNQGAEDGRCPGRGRPQRWNLNGTGYVRVEAVHGRTGQRLS